MRFSTDCSGQTHTANNKQILRITKKLVVLSIHFIVLSGKLFYGIKRFFTRKPSLFHISNKFILDWFHYASTWCFFIRKINYFIPVSSTAYFRADSFVCPITMATSSWNCIDFSWLLISIGNEFQTSKFIVTKIRYCRESIENSQ